MNKEELLRRRVGEFQDKLRRSTICHPNQRAIQVIERQIPLLEKKLSDEDHIVATLSFTIGRYGVELVGKLKD